MLEQESHNRNRAGCSLEGVETLKAQRVKLQHAVERPIDSFTDGLIDKDLFTSRMGRAKKRIADLEAKIKADAGDVDHLENLRLATIRLRALSVAVGPDLASC